MHQIGIAGGSAASGVAVEGQLLVAASAGAYNSDPPDEPELTSRAAANNSKAALIGVFRFISTPYETRRSGRLTPWPAAASRRYKSLAVRKPRCESPLSRSYSTPYRMLSPVRKLGHTQFVRRMSAAL
jgi:hypothetical protein